MKDREAKRAQASCLLVAANGKNEAGRDDTGAIVCWYNDGTGERLDTEIVGDGNPFSEIVDFITGEMCRPNIVMAVIETNGVFMTVFEEVRDASSKIVNGVVVTRMARNVAATEKEDADPIDVLRAAVRLGNEKAASETAADKKRKTRSDAGYPRKGGFYCLVTRDLPPFEGHPATWRETVLLTDNDEAVYFATIEEFKGYVAANVKVNESYQPVQTVGKPWGLIVGETAALL